MAHDAVSFHSQIAADFHSSYQHAANRHERLQVWRRFLDRYAKDAKLAYDIGCGSGILTKEVASRGISVFAIDGSAQMLAIARQSAASSGNCNIQFEQHRLPIQDTSTFAHADLVLSSSVIEYLESFPKALEFLHRLTAENGVVIFSVSNRSSVNRWIVRFVHRITGRPDYIGYIRHFLSVAEIRAHLQAVGLTYIEHAYFEGADRLNRLFGTLLPPKFSNNMIIVAARRQHAAN